MDRVTKGEKLRVMFEYDQLWVGGVCMEFVWIPGFFMVYHE